MLSSGAMAKKVAKKNRTWPVSLIRKRRVIQEQA